MKRRKFITTSVLGASALTTSFAANGKGINAEKKQLIELREYQLRFGTNAADLDNYLKSAFIPALNKFGVAKVGVFREYSKSEPAKLYVLIPYPAWEDYLTITDKIKADTDYIKASSAFNTILPDKIPYSRIASAFLRAFDKVPKLVTPAAGSKFFEMRTYEGHNEDAVQRKVGMFNNEEIDLFYKVGLSPVFFGEMLAGRNTPCLTYMVAFKDMADRDATWAKFSSHPEWNAMRQKPEYANSVSNIIKIFLEPVDYSQI